MSVTEPESKLAGVEVVFDELAETIMAPQCSTDGFGTGIRQDVIDELRRGNRTSMPVLRDTEFSIEASSVQDFFDVFGIEHGNAKYGVISEIFRLGSLGGNSAEIILKAALSQLISHSLALEEVYQRYRRGLAPKKEDYLFKTIKKDEIFYIISQIGQGAMGVVYVIVDPKHPRELQVIKSQQVAVEEDEKTSRWQSARGEDKDLFDRHTWEVFFGQALAKLGVNKTVADYISNGKRSLDDGSGNTIKQPFLRQTFKPGMTMEELVQASLGRALTVQENIDIALFVLAGLAKLHTDEVDIVHRDIKPTNLLVTLDGVIILDFGLAKNRSEILASLMSDGDADTLRKNITLNEKTMGSPAFMSPEQAKDAKNAGTKSDCYSFCCTLYYLFTRGRTIFQDKHGVQELLFAQAKEEPTEALIYIQEHLPKELAEVLVSGLSKYPAKRFTCEEMIARLIPLSSFAGYDSQQFFRDAIAGDVQLPLRGNILTVMREGKSSLPSGWIATFLDEREKKKEREAVGDEVRGLDALNSVVDSLDIAESPSGGEPLPTDAAIALLVQRAQEIAATSHYPPTSNDTDSLSKRTETTPPAVFGTSRRNFFRVLGTVAGLAALAEIAKVTGIIGGKEERNGVAKNQEKPKVQFIVHTESPAEVTAENVFSSSDLFKGTVNENDKLTELVLFKNMSCEMTLTPDRFLAHTKDGRVHMVTFRMELFELANYIGWKKEGGGTWTREDNEALKGVLPMSAELSSEGYTSPTVAVFNGTSAMLSPKYFGWLFTKGKDVSAYTKLAAEGFESSMGADVTVAAEGNFLMDENAREVLGSLPAKFDRLSEPNRKREFLDDTPANNQLSFSNAIRSWHKQSVEAQKQQ